jgi:superfamily I DNA/RNA helicase
MKDIAFATDDVVVYLAAAGAGKTSAIMDEMTNLLKTYRPDEIAFVTFTRKGVAHGIERALQANPQLSADDLVHFRTLHALCFRELGLARKSIIEYADITKFNKACNCNITMQEAFELQSEDDKLLSRYDAIRNGSTKGVLIHDGYDKARYAILIKAYEDFKTIHGLVDYYDCLLQVREMNKPVNVKVAFIDEAQDLTSLQWEVCQIAFSLAEKIRIAGDDYQSLFTYAGASPKTLIALSERYQKVTLETSYRLPKAVYRFAKGITCLIGDKIEKDFKPIKELEGFVREISDKSLLMHWVQSDMRRNGVTPYRWYFLFRNNCFIEGTAVLLEQYLIPYHTAHDFCVPVEDLGKIRRFYNYRKQGFGNKEAFEKFCTDYNIRDIHEDFTESNLITSERRYLYLGYIQKFGVEELVEIAKKEPFLLLSTTHRVKGGEADYVVVFLDCTRRVAENAMLNMDEELRVLYVACTRAKTGLFLVNSRGQYGLDNVVAVIKEQVA